MILDRSSWRPASETVASPPPRRIVGHAAGASAGEALRAGGGQLAVVPRGRRRPASPTASSCPTPGIRRPASTSAGGRRSPGSPTRARSCGAIACSSPAPSAPIRRRRSGPASTATATRPRIARRSAGCSTRSTPPDRQDRLGARRLRGPAARAAPHQVDLRQRHAGDRRPHRRRVVRLAGRLRVRHRRHAAVEGGSRPPRRRRLRRPDASSGAPPARRSSGTAW